MEILACGSTGITHPPQEELLGNAARANGDLLQLVYCLSKGQRLPALQRGRVQFKRGALRLTDRSQRSHIDLDVLTNLSHRACCTFLLSLLTKWGRTKAWHKLTHGSFSLSHKDLKRAVSVQGPVGILSSLLLPCTVSSPAQEVHRIPVTLVRKRRLHSSANALLLTTFGLFSGASKQNSPHEMEYISGQV